jgi:hypothetical protein
VGSSGSELFVQYSLDDGATWAEALDGDESPTLSLTTADDIEGATVEIIAEARADVLLGVFGRGGDGATDPAVARASIEFFAVAAASPSPISEDPGVADCNGGVYPVSRGLLALHFSDCGTFTDDGSGLRNVTDLTDFSGLSNTLAGGAVSGAWARRLVRSDAVTISAVNGHNPVSFKDAWLQWPTDLFDGVTEGELFILLKGDNGDPTALNDRQYSWQLGPSDDAKWADGVGAADTGHIYEDFGSNSMHDLGDAPGSLATWRVYNVRAAAGSYKAALDGSDFYTAGVNTVQFSAAPKMGNRGQNSQIQVLVIAIHSVILTSTERADVVAMLQDYAGL